MSSPRLPVAQEEAYAAALAGLPRISPVELSALIEVDGEGVASRAWDRVTRGVLHGRPGWSANRRAEWRRAATSRDPREILASCRAAGVRVLTPASDDYPERLRADPQRPAVLFAAGGSRAVDLARPVVTIVGTRQCSGYGRQVAQSLGQQLTRAGVVIASGLATGIDAAAHQGALGLDGPVLGVVATGPDVIYPRSSALLWRRVVERGLLLSEKPPGYGANPRSFVYRNRIMAGLADVVVVVESHRDGGSLSTVAAAAARGITVMAVPGPVTASSSVGTNALIADGCAPVRDHVDVLVGLGLARARKGRMGELAEAAPSPVETRRSASAAGGRQRRLAGEVLSRSRRASAADPSASDPSDPSVRAGGAPSPEESALLAQIDATPTRLEAVMARTGRRAGELALALDALEEAGLVEAGPGWWARCHPVA
jgi:DNA processing protein